MPRGAERPSLSYPQQIPPEISRQHPDHHCNDQSKYNSCRLSHRIPAHNTDDPSCNRGAGINLSHQDIGCLSCHDIPQHTSSDSGKNAYEDEKESLIFRYYVCGSLDADHSKNTETQGIAEHHDIVIIFVLGSGL